ncbi:hypothetical protein GCM10027425_22340 [Alteromonas gracilis]
MSDLPTWDDSTRPRRGPHPAYDGASATERDHGEHLRLIHDMYRQGLQQAVAVVGHVLDGTAEAGEAADALQRTGLRRALSGAGGLCQQICRGIGVHHRIEDAHLYPALRSSDPELAAVLDRLTEEHEVIEEALEQVEDTLLALMGDPERIGDLAARMDHLHALLLSHFAYEEEQLCTPLGVHRVMI